MCKTFTLYDLLLRGALISPDRPAVIHGDREISYRQLLPLVESVARWLENSQAACGDRIALLYENSVEYVLFYFAAAKAGLVVVPLDNSLKADQLGKLIADSGVTILLCQSKYLRGIDDLTGSEHDLKCLITDKEFEFNEEGLSVYTISDCLAGASEIDFETVVDDTPPELLANPLTHETRLELSQETAAIFYTSGSTGDSKGVMLSHRNLVSNSIATAEYLRLTTADSIMTILPFYYIYGNSLLLTHMLVGGAVILDNRFAFQQAILNTMRDKRATGFSGVPSNFMILLNLADFKSENFPYLRYLTQAGGSMAPEVTRKVMAAFPDKELFIMYGQTEASPRVTWLPPEKLKAKLGSIGIEVPGVKIRLVDENHLEVDQGKVGEIVVSGDNVMKGYWKGDGQDDILKDGQLFTGDLARRDEDGYYFVVGRKKDIVKVGGFRVSPKEIEELLLENDMISEVAVIGVPHEILGEALKAIVVLNPGVNTTEKEILDFCRPRLAMRKVPSFIYFVESLPKLQSGKIDKGHLRAEHG